MTSSIFSLLLVVCVSYCSAQRITFFRDGGFEGDALTVQPTNGTNACYDLPSDWSASPTSFNTSNVEGIIAYSRSGCTGDSNQFFAPVQWFGDIWNDRIVSYKYVITIQVPTPPVAPKNDPTYGVCKAVIVVDNYIVRHLNASLSSEQIYRKYESYFADIDAYYTNNFNTHFELAYIHVEETSSFTDTVDAGGLLDAFGQAVITKQFGDDMPTNACFYHLFTGRQPAGTAGLAWVGVTCNEGAPAGYTVDAQGLDGAGIVIRRGIHEIGHNMNGNHPDFYEDQTPSYNCSVDNDIGVYRILRDSSDSDVEYVYLEKGAKISECATQQITRSLTAYQCLYSSLPSPALPSVNFFQDSEYGGTKFEMAPRRGADACYNLMSFSDNPSSFNASSQITNVTIYEHGDCRGASITLGNPTAYVGNDWNDKASSFKFVLARGATIAPVTPPDSSEGTTSSGRTTTGSTTTRTTSGSTTTRTTSGSTTTSTTSSGTNQQTDVTQGSAATQIIPICSVLIFCLLLL